MSDQIGTVGAGQEVFTRGQCGPDEVVLEQRVAGRFFDFSLTHPARSDGAVVQQRGRPRRSVTAIRRPRVRFNPESSQGRSGAKRRRVDAGLRGAGYLDKVAAAPVDLNSMLNHKLFSRWQAQRSAYNPDTKENPRMAVKIAAVTVDCNDALAVARFWSAVLDRPIDPKPTSDFAALHLGDQRKAVSLPLRREAARMSSQDRSHGGRLQRDPGIDEPTATRAMHSRTRVSSPPRAKGCRSSSCSTKLVDTCEHAGIPFTYEAGRVPPFIYYVGLSLGPCR